MRLISSFNAPRHFPCVFQFVFLYAKIFTMKPYPPDSNTTDINKIITRASTPLNNKTDLDPLMKYIGDAKYVLLGEASHGTHEYYTWRAKISQRLIEEKGFSFIAVEGDWPDC